VLHVDILPRACRYEGIVPNYVRFGAIGASECDKEAPKLPPDDVYILIAPQVKIKGKPRKIHAGE
jgi:hypothetical protein